MGGIVNKLSAVGRFYYDGFRSMTIGRSLWIVILIKLFIIFAILKLFFFPNKLSDYTTDDDKADAVRNSLIIEK